MNNLSLTDVEIASIVLLVIATVISSLAWLAVYMLYRLELWYTKRIGTKRKGNL